MNTYQELVADFIAASRRMFVSPEYFIDLGTGMWIDVVAIEPSTKRVYLCEVTYSKDLSKLMS